jgi:hypothetical protein
MADNAQLTAAVAVEGLFNVGANPSPGNKISVTISNEGGQLTQKLPARQFFFLDSVLGTDEQALFNNKEDARKVGLTLPQGWKYEWDFTTGTRARLKIFTYNSIVLEKGQSLKIGLSNIISKTAPGVAALVFNSDFPPANAVQLSITKSADNPDIIYFSSIPFEGTPNLPGEKVTLKWRTYKLPRCELIQAGSADPLDYSVKSEKNNVIEAEKTVTCGSSDMSYTLSGYDGSKPIKRTLQVKVLRDGWQAAGPNDLFPGDPGYPPQESASLTNNAIRLQPSVLFNANDVALYGVFRHDYRDKERALLFRTGNPFGAWQWFESSVQNQPEVHIPEPHATSPGVYADDKLWLIGGSVVDPDNTSNKVWYIDPESGLKQWQCLDNAPWCPRMGHAALKFGNGIWIMGGRDEAGNALNDVWALDLKSLAWRLVGNAPWSPRCLFYPAVFNHQIGLYGGAEEPFSESLFDDLWVCDEKGRWREKDLQVLKEAGGTKPIAAGLQEFSGKLRLIGQFRQPSGAGSELIKTLAFSLDDESTDTWKDFSVDNLKNWGAGTTFSLQLVNFNKQMLIANALVYKPQESKADLRIYVSAGK